MGAAWAQPQPSGESPAQDRAGFKATLKRWFQVYIWVHALWTANTHMSLWMPSPAGSWPGSIPGASAPALTQSSIVSERSRGKRSHPGKHPFWKSFEPIIKPSPFWGGWSTQKVRVPAGSVENQALIDLQAQCKLPSKAALNWVCAEDEPPFHLRVTASSNPLSWAKHTRSQGGKWQHYASENKLCKIMHTNTQRRRTSNFFSQLWHILALQHVLVNSLKSSKNIFLALHIPIFSVPSFSRKLLIEKKQK